MSFLAGLAIAWELPAIAQSESVRIFAATTEVASASNSIVPAGATFICTPTAVWDGDGPVWCAEGPKIRIAGVAAREMDGSCRNNQPCPSVAAVEARDRLVRLLGGPKGTSSTGHVRVRAASMHCLSEG